MVSLRPGASIIELLLPSSRPQWIRLPLGLLQELHPEEILMTSSIFLSTPPWQVLWLLVLRPLYTPEVERIGMMEIGAYASDKVMKASRCLS